jgi:(p)ppGpp synthase/HD superfamily hydrolase
LERAISFIKQKHRGQLRAGGMPAWHHMLRVCLLLDFILDQTGEGKQKDKVNISLAALGHDLSEDTDAKKEEIVAIFGERALALIFGMTNRWEDKNPRPYIRQVVGSEETIRLIKLADLYDNILNVTYCFKILGKKWVTSFFVPIARPMRRAIIKTKFRRYKRSAKILILLVDIAMTLLERELVRN